MTLTPHEFIRRFLSHVVPHGFMRIRSFGFLGNACKEKKVKAIQTMLNYKPSNPVENPDIATLMLELTGKDIRICPLCKKGQLKRIGEIPSQLDGVKFDTS